MMNRRATRLLWCRPALLLLSWATLEGPPAVADDELALRIRFWEARLEQDDPDDDIAPTRLGTAYLLRARRDGDYDDYGKAEAVLRRAIEANPGNADARATLAFALNAQHKFREALAQAERAAEQRPDLPEARAALGDAALALGDTGRAAEAYASLDERPGGLFAHGRMANLHLARGETDAALRRLDRAIEAGLARGAPGDEVARCHVTAGAILMGLGRLDEAERRYRAALELTPGGVLPLEHLAELRALQGRLEESRSLYLEVIELAPRPEFFEALGGVFEKLGCPDEARSWRDRAIDGYRSLVDRGDIGYFRHLARFYSDVQPDPDEAISWARRDLEVRPEALSYDTLAWALHRAGQSEEAVAAIEQALESGLVDATVYYHAGVILRDAGDEERARTYLRRALETNPALPEAEEVRRLLADGREGKPGR